MALSRNARQAAQAQRLREIFALAQALHRHGRLDEAGRLYNEMLRMDARHADALHFLGLVSLQTGHAARGAELIEQALRARPDYPEALANLAIGYVDLGRATEALTACDKALALQPGLAAAYDTRGNALRALGRLAEALAAFDQAVALRADDAGGWCNRGNVLRDMHQHDEALASYDRALQLEPGFVEAQCNRGIVLHAVGRFKEARDALAGVIALAPGNAEAHYRLGKLLLALKQPDEALAYLETAVALKPDHADAWNMLGNARAALRREADALAAYEQAIALAPDYAAAHYNMGNTLLGLRREAAALPWLDRAVALRRDDAAAHRVRGLVLSALGRYLEALESYRMAQALAPGTPWLAGEIIWTRRQICDWSADRDDVAELIRGIEGGRPVAAPFLVAGASDSPVLQRRAAEIFANALYPPENAACLPAYRGHRRVRVGYFSADFRDHAMMHVMLDLFRAHDRGRFELTAFSFGPDTGDAWRQGVMAAFERFVDVRGMAEREVTALARRLEIDVAVDLMGFTLGCRPEIFSQRAAPVQVNYLGYPGTMGAPYIDYLIADRVVVPEGAERDYAEAIVRLPFSYQPNTRRHPVLARLVSRQEQGLPADGFVFCCFNNTYKITPAMFDIWLRILQRVSGTVLWLFVENETAVENLRRHAVAGGVAAERLVFAGRVPLDMHLARQGLADLFLDTAPYNGHATASLALWAGVPLLTRRGGTLAGRVAASLLGALDVPELIADSDGAYETIAVALAGDPDRLARLRVRLAAGRETGTLFDAARSARYLEAAFDAMHARAQAGLPPDHIWIDPD